MKIGGNGFSNISEVKETLKSKISINTIYVYTRKYRPDLIGTGPVSYPHQRIVNLLNDHQIDHEVNTRKVISPLELDIYIPTKNLAIEVNGVYWHSEVAGGKGKNYHINKTLECEKQGIQLLQLWDVEIEQKWEIVRSMLLNRLKKSVQSIPARKCSLIDVCAADARHFCNSTHLQGFRSGSSYRGLTYNNDLVCLLITGAPRYNRKTDLEILRFSSASDVRVQGGFSKLVSTLSGNLISYADRRYSNGKLYQSSNWSFVSNSAPSYYYTNDYQTFHHRSAFQKHKLPKILENFNPSRTEWENMQDNGFDRIWDCGTSVWIKKLS